MKNPLITRTAAFLLAAAAAFSLGSCGGSESSKAENGTVSVASDETASAAVSSAAESTSLTGETKTWGIFTVMVPDGWTLRQGDVLDDSDPNRCSVKKSDFSYFDLKSEKEEVQKQQYEYNKKTYTMNQKDISAVTIAGIEWNGFEYGNEMNPGFELYGSSNGRPLRVSCAGFKFDSPETNAILGSLSVSAAESTDASAAESTGGEDQPEVSADAPFAEKTAIKYNGVTFYVGQKFADIKEQLGKESKPSDKSVPCVPGAQDVENFYYPGLSFQVNYEGNIISISLSNDFTPGNEASTAGGLRLGDDLAKVKKVLGEPTTEDEFGCKYTEGSITLSVMLRENEGVFIISLTDESLPY